MKRNIITIDEDRCTGCGECVPDCPEGALQIIDGKARLVSDLFCDGLGACIGTCPEGAITVVEREAEPYDERRVMMENIIPKGPEVIKAHLKHLRDHGEEGYFAEAVSCLEEKGIAAPAMHDRAPCHGGGCPGSQTIDLRKAPVVAAHAQGTVQGVSELRQWPVQLKLLNPGASYFDNADLLIAADCVPFAYGNFHERFLKGKIVIMFCPKLDPYSEEYIEKLTAIFTGHKINSITIARMEVPCCGGVTALVDEALDRSGKRGIIKEYVISVRGDIL
ncbi:MAG TPA: 4Fe-4S binding protein [Spirochaetota bacterium]|nr:4Fe-4S binding protein [Spirochaetota bacterium]